MLWHCADGGTTWTPLRGASLIMSNKLNLALPPGYPDDPTIFGIGMDGVYRSDDGGANFREVVVAGQAGMSAALDPTSPAGDARVFVQYWDAGSKPLVYTEKDGRLHPLAGLPADTIEAMLFAPAANAAYFNVTRAMAPASPTLYACPATQATCTQVGPQAGYASATSPTFDVDHTYFAVSQRSSGNTLQIGTVTSGYTSSVPIPQAQSSVILPAADYAGSGSSTSS